MPTLQWLVTAYSVCHHQFVAFAALVSGSKRFIGIFSEKRAAFSMNTDVSTFSAVTMMPA